VCEGELTMMMKVVVVAFCRGEGGDGGALPSISRSRERVPMVVVEEPGLS